MNILKQANNSYAITYVTAFYTNTYVIKYYIVSIYSIHTKMAFNYAYNIHFMYLSIS